VTVFWTIAVLGLVAWLWIRFTQPTVFPLSGAEDISRSMNILLLRGANRARFIVRLKQTPARTVEVVKTVRGFGDYDCRCEARISSNPNGAAALRGDLRSRGIAYQESGSGNDAKIVVPVATDRGLGAMATWLAVQHLLSASPSDCECKFDLVAIPNAPRLTGVDAPDSPWFK
jgi:hypothetical protein